MSILKGLIDSIAAVFADAPKEAQQNPKASGVDPTPGGGETQTLSSVMNERIAYKLKGYFDLAKEEIDKAIRAEEWGLIDDAILHYKHAHRILVEAGSTPVPSYISSSERQKVKAYSEKISEWKDQVTNRLQVLSKRAGVSPTLTVSSPSKATNRVVHGPTIPKRTALIVGKQSAGLNAKPSQQSASGKAKPSQQSADVKEKTPQESASLYDDKLIEMINTVIVDRSPSVKWDDVGGKSSH